jgi:hypothetical protein
LFRRIKHNPNNRADQGQDETGEEDQ